MANLLFRFILIGLILIICQAHNLRKLKENILKLVNEKNDKVDFIILRQIWPEPTCMFPGVSAFKLLTLF